MTIHDLPALNAFLNSCCTILLLTGYFLIKKRKIAAHRAVMLSAFGVSLLFLTSYLIYHAQVGSVHFMGTGPIRPVYFTILITHTLLAVTIPPLAIVTLNRGLRSRFDRHKAIARWTLPIWLYVSVTGVVVYLMLYKLFPSA